MFHNSCYPVDTTVYTRLFCGTSTENETESFCHGQADLKADVIVLMSSSENPVKCLGR